MYCPKCGTQNDDNNFKCISCNQILHNIQQTPFVQTSNGTLGGLIPYKNAPALTAYYLGIFSFIPFIGIFLGIAAFILGLKGLRLAKEHPEIKGKIHAWVGVIAGGLFGFVYLIVSLVVIIKVMFFNR